jgi:hypothetical protein
MGFVERRANRDDSMGLTACAQSIAVVEAELEKLKQLREQYRAGTLPSSSLLPVRHFCAELVETAVELARSIGTMSNRESESSTSDHGQG